MVRFFWVVLTLFAFPTASPSRPSQVERWGRWELSLSTPRYYPNPFADVRVHAFFQSPSGKRYQIEGFYDGDGTWKVRFMPDEIGLWKWRVWSEPHDQNLKASGTFRCLPSDLPGPLRVHPENPLWFAFANGRPVYLLAFHLWNLDAMDEKTLAETLDFLRRFGFNAIVGPHLTMERMVWGRTPGGKVDFDRFDLNVWKGLDRALSLLAERRMVLIPFSIVGGTNGLPKPPSRRVLDRLLRYWVARWAGFWNATFQPVSEWEEGYREAEILWIGRRLWELDLNRHLISVHSLRASTKSVQGATWFSYHTVQDKLRDYHFRKYIWFVDLFRSFPKPIFAHECLWEGNFYQKEAGLDVENLRKAAWVIALSGGQINYADEVVPPRRWRPLRRVGMTFSEIGKKGRPNGHLYPYLHHLAQFLRSLPFWRLRPHPESVSTKICLAEPNRLYVVYAPKGGTLVVDLTKAAGKFAVVWFNPRTGKRRKGGIVSGGQKVSVTAPDTNDWVLLIY